MENALVSLVVGSDGSIVIALSLVATIAIVSAVFLFVVLKLVPRGALKDYRVEEVTLNVRGQQIKFIPNADDRLIAYKTWVEIKTRKLGVPFTDDDVVSEVFDSWYEFFGVCRQLLKTFPIQKINHNGGQGIIDNLLSLLNDELRPHLNRWQAEYRKWFREELQKEASKGKSPQIIQQSFPDYDQMMSDLKSVNAEMISFANDLEKIFRRET